MANDWVKLSMNPTWDFEQNKELVGIYIGKREEVGANKSNLYDFQLADGTFVSVWGNSVFDNRLQNINPGMEVKIIYLGKTKSEKTGREFKNFDIFHRTVEKDQN